jgi:putative ABC transport system permease protein
MAVSLQVFLVLLIVGLTSGVLADWGERAEGVGADLMVQPPNSSIFFAFSGAVMPESVCEKIAKVPGVDEEAPVFILVNTGNLNVIYGIDETRFEGLSKGFQFLSGHGLENPDDVIADDLVAQSMHLRVGKPIRLMNRDFNVAGIVVHGKGARFFIAGGSGHCGRRETRFDGLCAQQRKYRHDSRGSRSYAAGQIHCSLDG